jgi:hypothetical protein
MIDHLVPTREIHIAFTAPRDLDGHNVEAVHHTFG